MVILTDEEFPQLLVIRSRNVESWKKESKNIKIRSSFGPFPHGGELREALKIIRKIFPYRDAKCPGSSAKRPCFNYQIGLCPGPCANAISKNEYMKTVRRLELFFQGKKDELIKKLEKEMYKSAKEEKFEEANRLKRTIYALEHIQDVGLIKRDMERVEGDTFRIEAYDIAHISGSSTVGVMVVIEDGELAKSQYRKFRIRGREGKVTVDDPKNLKEVLMRRLGHAEWTLPNLIVVDGSVIQINAAKEVLFERGFNIDIAAVTKDVRHKAKEIVGEKKHIEAYGKSILLANAEAHRFAIGYHRKLRNKGFRI
jgi:excinuclease ABC subunit C